MRFQDQLKKMPAIELVDNIQVALEKWGNKLFPDGANIPILLIRQLNNDQVITTDVINANFDDYKFIGAMTSAFMALKKGDLNTYNTFARQIGIAQLQGGQVTSKLTKLLY